MRTAHRDPRLVAQVVARRPLVYTSAPADAPRHVRAASGLCRPGPWLVAIQDDAAWLALIDPPSGEVRALPLPPGPDGLRVYEKATKPDFEACFADAAGVVWAFGSGSRPARERIAQVGETTRIFDAAALYGQLRARADFAGSELNVEGALLLPGGTLRLFQRGNGAGAAVDATADLDWPAVVAWLDGRGDAPTLRSVTAYHLGALEGVRVTFTDAAMGPGALLFTAAAEASPDAYADGAVAGSVLGVFDPDGALRWAPLTDGAGRTLPVKVEGLDWHDGGAWAVTDADDPERPSELLRVELRGPWWLAAA
jgi:hypothetical protein